MKAVSILFFFIGIGQVKAQLAVEWYKNSEALSIYNPKKSVYNPIDSCIYTAGMYSGQFEMDGLSVLSTFPKAFFLMKTKQTGEIVWLKTVAENSYNVELTSNVVLTTDSSGDLYAGITFNGKLFFGSDSTVLSDDSFTTGGMLFKLDTSGTKIWTRQIYTRNIQALAANLNQYIFLTGANTSSDVYLSSYSELGDSLWTKTGGSNSGWDEGLVISFDTNNNIYLGGRVEPNTSVYFDSEHPVFVNPYFSSCFLAKYSILGNIEWVRCFYTSNFPKYIFYRSICIQNDKVIIAGGFEGGVVKFSPSTSVLSSSTSMSTSFLICYDTNGALIWKKTPRKCLSGGEGLELGLVFTNRLIYSSSFHGSVIISQDTLSAANNDLVLEEFDTLGNSIWHKRISGGGMDGATSFIKVADDLVLNISTKSTALQLDNTTMTLAPVSDQMVLVRFHVSTLGIPENKEDVFTVYPNPGRGSWNLGTSVDVSGEILQVYNAFGQLIYQQVLGAGNTHEVNVELDQGIYFVKIAGMESEAKRLIIQ